MSDDILTVYEKPTCTTCRKLVTVLEEEGIPFDRVNYFIQPLTVEGLRDLLEKAGLEPREALRTRAAIHKRAGLDRDDVTDEEILQAMVEDPNLLQRPIVEKGDRAVLARPVERVREIL